MTEHEYTRLLGERVHDENLYRLRGLPEGKDFRKDSSYDTLEAGMLFIEGVGFAANAFELSQHEKRVVVEQETERGQARITFRDAD